MPDHTLDAESERLDTMTTDALARSGKLSVSETVSVYFQAISVASFMAVDSGSDVPKARKILDRFNNLLHPLVESHLSLLIDELSNRLRSSSAYKDSQTSADLYDALRELMSTREFVGQYTKGLT